MYLTAEVLDLAGNATPSRSQARSEKEEGKPTASTQQWDLGFVPRDQQQWDLGNGTTGCIRKTQLNCYNDGFEKFAKVKVSRYFVRFARSYIEATDNRNTNTKLWIIVGVSLSVVVLIIGVVVFVWRNKCIKNGVGSGTGTSSV
ncbi:hypothetical protein ACFE04_007117 [Oxalis oulophora]